MADEIIVGATKKSLVVTVEDDNGNAVDLRGGAVKLQGHSGELPTSNLNVAGALTDAQNGVCTWAQLGGASYVTEGALTAAGVTSATYACRVKYTDSATLVDYGPLFNLTWLAPPIAT